jgi:2-(3-amino-3-carboxypropyl)histidine synthase
LTISSDLVRELAELNVHTVALQAPEGLKRKLPGIAADLKEAGYTVLLSGDPCYGACDLDTALLQAADILVHIGHARVDGTERVLYHLFSQDFDPSVVRTAIPLLTGKEVGLVTTVQHAHLIPAMTGVLREAGISAIVAEGSARTPYNGQILGCSFESARKTRASEILYVGTGRFHPLGVQLATGARVIACDPFRMHAEPVDGERLIRRRFALIERARQAGRFGILLSKKSGQCRQELAERLLSLSESAVLIPISEVTPDQLLNLGMPCYVNTACPRLAYDDQVRWPVPVLSPPEFEILCGAREFEQYAIDEIL